MNISERLKYFLKDKGINQKKFKKFFAPLIRLLDIICKNISKDK